MKVTMQVVQEFDVKTLHVRAGVRYWEDATVNGVEDANGDLIPCREGNNWKPIIDVDSGTITNWKQGTTARIHYKVCDDGEYTLRDADGKEIVTMDGYVPETMYPEGNGYGDYIIMNVDENGVIARWKFIPEEFAQEAEE